MTREEYKMIQKLIDSFYKDHLSNECYKFITRKDSGADDSV